MNSARHLVAAVLWANASSSPQTRLRRLEILAWLSGRDRDRFPTLTALADHLGVSRQAAHRAVDDLKAFVLADVDDPVDANGMGKDHTPEHGQHR